MDIKTPLQYITGVGPQFAKRLEKLELFTVENLINHYPFRYEDYSKIGKIAEAKEGETVTFQGELGSIKDTYTKSGKVMTTALLNDVTGSIGIIWFNQRWLSKVLITGDKLQVSGKVDRFKGKICLMSPAWEKVETETIHTGRLVPVYPETYGISSKWIRTKMSKLLPEILPKVSDHLPNLIRGNMLTLAEALQQIHFPDNWDKFNLAKARLSFDELFFIQLTAQKQRLLWQKKQATKPLLYQNSDLLGFMKSLPFELTSSQKKVIGEICQDLQKDQPMNRLLQGEVGSGKTVVAAAVIYLTCLNNLRVTLMAPTEILAFQHFETLTKFLAPYNLKVGIYTGSKKAVSDEPILVGTHALLSEKLPLENMGLVIIVEQQKFGVEQRSLLRQKSGLRTQAKSPHFLTMTATPIPRTVALTLYGDLDLSVIEGLPKNRKEIKTHFVPTAKRNDAYGFIEKHIRDGEQAYIITPLIEESETNLSAKAVKVEFEHLKSTVFPKLKLGLLHGRLKAKEKELVIDKFRKHEIDILVSTSVVEVGVDVPNATIMVIEGAENFGLAGLHQLRGRVGRGQTQSYALLFAENETPQVISRLKNLEKINDGLKLAELDLKTRGSGEIFGAKQSGRWNMKIASLSDIELVEKTREAAKILLSDNLSLDKYPLIASKLSDLAEKVLPD